MAIYKVSYGFTSLSDGELTPEARAIIKALTGNPAFENPPVSVEQMTASCDAYAASLVKCKNGTVQDTLDKDLKREALENALRQVAAYVQSQAGQDLQTLLSSGFKAASTNRSQIALSRPSILRVENVGAGQLAVRAEAVPTAKSYEARVRSAANDWQTAGVFTAATKVVLSNLSPGTMYSIQVRAIGGSTGSSEWSDPVQHMSL